MKVIEEQKKKKFPWNWFFTIFMFLEAVASYPTLTASFLLFLGSIFISPPFNKLLKEKYNISISTKTKVIVALILQLIAGYAIPNAQVNNSLNEAYKALGQAKP